MLLHLYIWRWSVNWIIAMNAFKLMHLPPSTLIFIECKYFCLDIYIYIYIFISRFHCSLHHGHHSFDCICVAGLAFAASVSWSAILLCSVSSSQTRLVECQETFARTGSSGGYVIVKIPNGIMSRFCTVLLGDTSQTDLNLQTQIATPTNRRLHYMYGTFIT